MASMTPAIASQYAGGYAKPVYPGVYGAYVEPGYGAMRRGPRPYHGYPGPMYRPQFARPYAKPVPMMPAGPYAPAYPAATQPAQTAKPAAEAATATAVAGVSGDAPAADANGAPLTQDAFGNWEPAATYQYIEVCETSSQCDTFRYAADGEL